MTVFGSKKNLYIDGWILTALLLLGYNVFALVSMFNPPLVGHSDEVRMAREKWQQLQERNSFSQQKTGECMDLDQILLRFASGYQKQETQAIISQEDKIKNTTETELPILTGIMRLSDVHGNTRLVAVIQGKTYTENTLVQGHMLQQITEKGIVLTKAGISRFVPTPKVYFSLDRSGLTAQDKPGATEAEESSNVSE